MSDEIFAAVHARPKRRQGITGQTIDAQMRSTMCQITEWELEELCDELVRLRAEVERLTAALSDERAHADAMAEALTSFIDGGNRQLALISRKVRVTDPMTLTVTKGQLLAAIEARAAHRARRQG